MMQIPTLAVACGLLALPVMAQPGGGPRAPQAPKAAAPIDLTGNWLSMVNEDWKYRMVMPAAGDYQGVPMTPAGRRMADTWDADKDIASGDQCKAYGAPNLLRQPGMLKISWQDDQTLKMEADAGAQTRTFHFGNWKAPEGPKTLQGNSVATWETQRTAPGEPKNGTLKVVTTGLKAGYLRKNGVPYSDGTELTEYYDIVTGPGTQQALVVTTITTDPMYLREPFIVTTHFKKMPNDSAWKPNACSAKW